MNPLDHFLKTDKLSKKLKKDKDKIKEVLDKDMFSHNNLGTTLKGVFAPTAQVAQQRRESVKTFLQPAPKMVAYSPPKPATNYRLPDEKKYPISGRGDMVGTMGAGLITGRTVATPAYNTQNTRDTFGSRLVDNLTLGTVKAGGGGFFNPTAEQAQARRADFGSRMTNVGQTYKAVAMNKPIFAQTGISYPHPQYPGSDLKDPNRPEIEGIIVNNPLPKILIGAGGAMLGGVAGIGAGAGLASATGMGTAGAVGTMGTLGGLGAALGTQLTVKESKLYPTAEQAQQRRQGAKEFGGRFANIVTLGAIDNKPKTAVFNANPERADAEGLTRKQAMQSPTLRKEAMLDNYRTEMQMGDLGFKTIIQPQPYQPRSGTSKATYYTGSGTLITPSRKRYSVGSDVGAASMFAQEIRRY